MLMYPLVKSRIFHLSYFLRFCKTNKNIGWLVGWLVETKKNIGLFVCLFVCLSVCLFVCLFVVLSADVSRKLLGRFSCAFQDRFLQTCTR